MLFDNEQGAISLLHPSVLPHKSHVKCKQNLLELLGAHISKIGDAILPYASPIRNACVALSREPDAKVRDSTFFPLSELLKAVAKLPEYRQEQLAIEIGVMTSETTPGLIHVFSERRREFKTATETVANNFELLGMLAEFFPKHVREFMPDGRFPTTLKKDCVTLLRTELKNEDRIPKTGYIKGAFRCLSGVLVHFDEPPDDSLIQEIWK